MTKDKKVVAIVGVGLGVILIGALALAAKKKPPVPPPETGMITLYMTGTPTQEWTVGWYYADRDAFLHNIEYYPPAGFETPWKRPGDPCTPPEPIDINNLMVKIETYSEIHTCPLTGILGSCRWGEYGPFSVEDGGVYTIDITTGILTEVT